MTVNVLNLNEEDCPVVSFVYRLQSG